MIYDSEVSFVLCMQSRCALFVALYIPGLVTWQFYSFPWFPLSQHTAYGKLQVIEPIHTSVSGSLRKMAQAVMSTNSQFHL